MAEQPSHDQQQQQYTKRSAAHCIRKFVRCVNCFAILSSLLSIAAVLALRHHPTWTGWVLFSLAVVTIVAATFGCVSAEGRCLSLQFLTVGLSLGGLGVASLALLIKHPLLKKHLKSELSHYHTRIFFQLITVLFLVMLCTQIIVLVLAFTLRQCDYADYYEDLEKRNLHSRKNLAKVQEESELRAVVHEGDQAQELCKKMKQKYGQWTQEGEFDSIK